MGALPAPRIVIEYLSNETTNFGPVDAEGRTKGNARALGIIADASSVGFSWYSRFPSNAFFTLRQNSRHNPLLTPGLTHLRFWYVDQATGYGPVLVFNGRLGDPDESGEDVVWTAWNYLTELALSRTGYEVKYPGKLIGTEVVQKEWERDDAKGRFVDYGAKVQPKGLLRHIATGTIENPKAREPSSADAVTDKQFQVVDVPRLLLFYDMTEMGRANTIKNVTMGITRSVSPAFFFLKDAGTALTAKRLEFPGNVVDFRYVPGALDVRNDLATVATSKDNKPIEITDSVAGGTYGYNAFGRRQDTFAIKTLVGYKGLNDYASGAMLRIQRHILDRALMEATQPTRALRVDVRTQRFAPFDGWDIEDTIVVQIRKGRTNIDRRYRIVGIRGTLDDSGFRQQLFLVPPVS